MYIDVLERVWQMCPSGTTCRCVSMAFMWQYLTISCKKTKIKYQAKFPVFGSIRYFYTEGKRIENGE